MVSSELAFNNFLMTRKLDELLELVQNEKDEYRSIYVQRAINLKVNYLDDYNRKLEGMSLIRHQKQIRMKYSNTKFAKYIVFNETKNKYFTNACKALLISLVFAGVYYNGSLTNFNLDSRISMIKSSLLEKKYTYEGKEMSEKALNKILNISLSSGNIAQNEERFGQAIDFYLKAKDISEILNNETVKLEIDNKIRMVKSTAEVYLQNRVEELRKMDLISVEKLKNEVSSILDLSYNLGFFDIQGKVFEVQGENAFANNELSLAKNYFILATKFIEDSREIENKITNLEKLINIKTKLQEIKILKLQEKEEGIENKYREAKEMYRDLPNEYKSLDILKELR